MLLYNSLGYCCHTRFDLFQVESNAASPHRHCFLRLTHSWLVFVVETAQCRELSSAIIAHDSSIKMDDDSGQVLLLLLLLIEPKGHYHEKDDVTRDKMMMPLRTEIETEHSSLRTEYGHISAVPLDERR